MRFLVDSCAGPSIVRTLRELSHDVSFVGEWPSDPGDTSILEKAFEERRTLITLDSDFGRLIVKDGYRHAGVIRLTDELTIAERIAACTRLIVEIDESQMQQMLITVRRTGNRIRFC